MGIWWSLQDDKGREKTRSDTDLCSDRNEPCREKTNVLVSDLVRHKPGCTATEDD